MFPVSSVTQSRSIVSPFIFPFVKLRSGRYGPLLLDFVTESTAMDASTMVASFRGFSLPRRNVSHR